MIKSSMSLGALEFVREIFNSSVNEQRINRQLVHKLAPIYYTIPYHIAFNNLECTGRQPNSSPIDGKVLNS